MHHRDVCHHNKNLWSYFEFERRRRHDFSVFSLHFMRKTILVNVVVKVNKHKSNM